MSNVATAVNETPLEVQVESRFGTICLDVSKAVLFPHGLLGLPQDLRFCLTEIPQKNMGSFKLLQSLDDPSLSFVTLPIELDNPLIDRKDLEECIDVLRVEEENLIALLVISLQRSPGGVRITANLRAPIIIDANDKMAMQYVFPSSKYDIAHVISQ